MNPLLYTLPLVTGAYLAVADAQEAPVDHLPPVEILAAPLPETDPVTGKLWDRRAGEWVTFEEFTRRVRAGKADRVFEQAPGVEPVIRGGFHILAERQEAVRRHWEHVLYLERQLCKGIKCPN